MIRVVAATVNRALSCKRSLPIGRLVATDRNTILTDGIQMWYNKDRATKNTANRVKPIKCWRATHAEEEIQMTRAKKSQEIAVENNDTNAVVDSSTAMAEQVVEATIEPTVETEEIKMERANKIAIKIMDDGYVVDFYRTHKHLLSINSNDTAWIADEADTKTAQRESFRKFMIENASQYNILWNPIDQRTDSNRRFVKYQSDDELAADAVIMLTEDVKDFMAKLPTICSEQIKRYEIVVDEIVPMTHTQKGMELSALGIIDGRYANDNWAWADVNMTVLITTTNDSEVYISLMCKLVSGQLKKPIGIYEAGYTQTGWNVAIKTELTAAGILVEEKKEDKKADVECE